MFYLILVIFSSALVSIVMRLSEYKVKNNIGMLTVNYLACTLITTGYAMGSWPGLGSQLHLTAGFGVVNGLLYLISFVLLQVNVQRNGVVLSSTFMKLGLLVSLVVSVVFFREIPDGLQILGFVLAVGAIILINYKKQETAAEFKSGLIWLLLSGGMGDSMSKIFGESGVAKFEAQFLFFTFLTALVFCTMLMLVKGQKPGKWELLFGVLIAIPNYFSSKFLLGALETVPAVIVYPVYSVGSILIVTLTGVLLFRERLAKQQWAGIAAILVALVLLNV